MAATKKKVFDPVPDLLLGAARVLRKSMTDAEQLLWFHLRRRQVDGFRFRRQHPFEKYVLDFYCPEVKVAVELDGGQHNEDRGICSDLQRTAFLEEHGIMVVRVWNHEIFQNMEGVLQMIHEILLGRVEAGCGRTPPP